MKEVILNKTKDFQIGNVRVSEVVFNKVEYFAKKNKVTNQTIVRVVLENFIDEIKFI